MFGALKQYIPWLLTTALSLILIFSSQNRHVVEMKANLSDLVVVCTKPVSSILNWSHIWKENRKLHKHLSEMSLTIAKLEGVGTEAQRLREMLNFKNMVELEIVAAEVTGITPDPGITGLLIDHGSNDGLSRNQAVIIPNGLVGRIYRVGKESAAVQLLTDPNIGVAGILIKGREKGIVHASTGNTLTFDGVPVTANIELGDSVLTSGLGGIFPEGLFIGIVINISSTKDGWLFKTTLRPAVDFGKIEEVFVVRERHDLD